MKNLRLGLLLFMAPAISHAVAATPAPSDTGMAGTLVIMILLVCGMLYFVPTAVAQYRKASNKTTVLLVNLFFGWTFIGWIVALILAFAGDSGEQARRHRELIDALNKQQNGK